MAGGGGGEEVEEGWSQVQPGPLCGHSGGTLPVNVWAPKWI